jgi:hypothetical protein
MAASAVLENKSELPTDLESLIKEVRNLKVRVEEERSKVADVSRA